MAGVLAWFAAGGPTTGAAALEPAARQIAALRRPPATPQPAHAPDVTGLADTPLFTLTTGPNATPEPVVQLIGLVRSRERVAALVAINDRPAEWMLRGEARDGVTLQAVMSGGVLVDTVYGPREVALGERSAGSSAGPASPSPATPAAPASTAASSAVPSPSADTPPRGFRMPPPPASAPRPR